MSDTPRTDREEVGAGYHPDSFPVVSADFARQLERELSGALEVLRRYEEIKETVTVQVLAGDAIRRAAS